VQLEQEALARIQAALAGRYAAAIAGPEIGMSSGFQGTGYWGIQWVGLRPCCGEKGGATLLTDHTRWASGSL
jgi:hypothetical protein